MEGNFVPGKATTTVGEHRDQYAAEVEPRPSRFGPEYAGWAERADAWREEES
ncbi:MAG: hypothetical protein LCH43_11450 [Actinobacteria bacterium]|nr:hypothetical protein [Actinomycetota bacterium]